MHVLVGLGERFALQSKGETIGAFKALLCTDLTYFEDDLHG